MQIRVKCSCGENCPEWAMVELQGMVEVQPQFKDRLQNLKIGLLCRPSSPETYTFTVGYHELTGTKLPLKKPLLVLNKVEDAGEEGSSGRVELEVIGIIRHRILFKTRPKALISKAQPTAKERATLASSK
ncbi:chromosome transmission fidelity protein 8 homolog [Rosa chinensis]|uniref:chromosome transmission fidelity protein 8 homolog n=1 Tax=Rosa chinensis TaxID=74649 RepID=UPI000D093B82|nr:chromosome transmission fidelity protein 8 homolog [Rosa chinensis]